MEQPPAEGIGTKFRRWRKFNSAHSHLKSNKPEPLFNFKIQDKDLGQLGVVSLPSAWERESPRPLLTDIHAADSIRVWGANKDGTALYVQVFRRQNRVSEVVLHLQVEDDVYHLPLHPFTNAYNTDGKTFSTSGLNFDILEPLRRWRVNFDGYLRRMSDGRVVAATFNFLCTPISNYVSYPEDFNEHILAKYLSKTDFKPSEIYEKFSQKKHILTSQLYGHINIDGLEEKEVILRGFKERSFGCLNWKKTNHLAYIEVYLKNATSLGIYIEDQQDGIKKFVYGFFCPPCNMALYQMTECEIDWNALKSPDFPKELNINFTAGKKKYNLKMKWLKQPYKSLMGEDGDSESSVHFCQVDLNGRAGDGVVHVFSNESRANRKAPPIQCSLPFFKEPEMSTCEEFVVPFEDMLCRSSNIVGGKGASLALMTAINNCQTDFENNFTVPPGLCVTKTAFQLHLKENPIIEEALNKLQSLALSAGSVVSPALQEECTKVTNVIANTQVSTKLKVELAIKLKEKFGDDFESIRFAVRSSAIGEDGEEMSAAGQNETFLGVKGLEQVVDRLRKCWASQFAFRSVEYKRHNAQLLQAGMGVVIQQMVAAEVAGVLFSRHPLTGSATRMVITANYGLGESVVSASADPDTISVRRAHTDHLAVEEVSTGSKKTLIRMCNEEEEGDTEETETEAELASHCCLSRDMAIRLAKIAIFLEKCFGSGRDIEWAIYQQRVYILQSRPVTTNSAMTDFEIMHEFDTSFKIDEESHTTANVSEVMPGAQTPLSATSAFKAQMPFFQRLFQWKIDYHKFDPIVMDGIGCYYGHPMFNLIYQKGWALNEKKQGIEKAMDIGIYGRPLDDEDITKLALERFEIRPPLRQKMYLGIISAKGMLCGKRQLKKTTKEYKNYHVPRTGKESAREYYEIIGSHLTKSIPAMDTHMSVTMASTMWNLITLNILSNGTGEFTNDQYTDFALIIGSANGAESGNVPLSLRELADVIAETADMADFATVEPKKALEMLLKSKNETVTKKFQNFLERHGHRGLKEIDFIGVSWGMDPKQVAAILQGMLRNKSDVVHTSKVNTWEEIESSLKTPLTPFKKWMLKRIMKSCRSSVCNREQAKSWVIKFFNEIRLAYRHLAQLMINEGFILNQDLIYFFTHEEIGQLLDTRSPKFIRRAKHRQKMHPIMDKLKFPEIIYGFPKPENNENVKLADDGTIIKGTTVSQGVIQGPARVVKSFHDVHTIKSGEILITHATDIGWSPYFPMLNGIVTEIGGLISHGAVVAREFGLPCIVGVTNATDIFQSGDVVLLNATQGTITKIGKIDDNHEVNHKN